MADHADPDDELAPIRAELTDRFTKAQSMYDLSAEMEAFLERYRDQLDPLVRRVSRGVASGLTTWTGTATGVAGLTAHADLSAAGTVEVTSNVTGSVELAPRAVTRPPSASELLGMAVLVTSLQPYVAGQGITDPVISHAIAVVLAMMLVLGYRFAQDDTD